MFLVQRPETHAQTWCEQSISQPFNLLTHCKTSRKLGAQLKVRMVDIHTNHFFQIALFNSLVFSNKNLGVTFIYLYFNILAGQKK